MWGLEGAGQGVGVLTGIRHQVPDLDDMENTSQMIVRNRIDLDLDCRNLNIVGKETFYHHNIFIVHKYQSSMRFQIHIISEIVVAINRFIADV